jgi:SagB-type dehydrogenase family enzyme
MKNSDIQIAHGYHDATKHSYWSVRTSAHYLDWDNHPHPFKVYNELEPVALPSDLVKTDIPALHAVQPSVSLVNSQAESVPDLSQLAHVLFYSAGITKKSRRSEVCFRAAACAGALYPIEVYVVCGDLPGLDAGIYHFSPAEFALRRLRQGDYRRALVHATAGEDSVAHAPAILVYTAITWRSSWKYEARSYRYHYWDCGMVVANTMAAAAANRLAHKVVMGFADDEVNRLIGVDGGREMALTLVPLGRTTTRTPQPHRRVALTELDFNVLPLSHEEADYPLIREIHSASKLAACEEVLNWRSRSFELSPREPEGPVYRLTQIDERDAPTEMLEAVILRRGSTRRFAHKPLTLEQFSVLLESAVSPPPTDFHATGAWLNDLYINVHAVEGLPGGAYFFHRRERAVELLMKANFRRSSSFLCLEQDLGGDSSATIFFLADLTPILERYGNRGYRAAQMEAAIIGGRMYLAAYALGRGATGLTFYDDDVIDFFSPHSAGKSAIFVMALGAAGRRPVLE